MSQFPQRYYYFLTLFNRKMSWNMLPFEIRSSIRELTVTSRHSCSFVLEAICQYNKYNGPQDLKLCNINISNPIILQIDSESRKHGRFIYCLLLPDIVKRNAYIIRSESYRIYIVSPKIDIGNEEWWKINTGWRENEIMQEAIRRLLVQYLQIDASNFVSGMDAEDVTDLGITDAINVWQEIWKDCPSLKDVLFLKNRDEVLHEVVFFFKAIDSTNAHRAQIFSIKAEEICGGESLDN